MEISVPENCRSVSSAKINVKKELALGRSFINKMNRRGPKMEPWGTPHVISLLFDLIPEKQLK